MSFLAFTILAFLGFVAIYDLLQKKHAVIRNFPIVGHLRYILEAVGPELRQYIVTDNNEERPFSRDQRRWVYASSKEEDNYFGFGTDEDLENSGNFLIVKHSAFPISPLTAGDSEFDSNFGIPCAKTVGAARQRLRQFRPTSVVNISGMSFGSISGPAVEAMNRGAGLAGCLQSTGEGGVAPQHNHGGDLIWQIGTGYFRCRDDQGKFSLARCCEVVDRYPVRALEIKLSQGAKPGAGGMLPAAKISAEIAAIRGIPRNQDCISPAAHTAFGSVDELLDFVELLAEKTGLPVGIKSAVGERKFWVELATAMESGDRGVDFITIDGGEGGTGAGPLVFTDHVALPFKLGFAAVYRIFAERQLTDRVVFVGSGKLGWPEAAIMGFALGCDMINVGRSAMLAVGCIQAQRCHTNHCPTGVATQNRWLMRGLDPTSKAARLANYIVTLRKEILALSHACGFKHPAHLTGDHLEIIDDRFGRRPFYDVFGYQKNWGRPSDADLRNL